MRQILKQQKPTLIDYIPACYRAHKDSYVEYYAVDPATGKLERKRIRLNRIKSATERRKFANKLIRQLNMDLEAGWNPFVEEETPLGNNTLFSAMDDFLLRKKKEGKREDTIRTYNSFVNILKEYIKEEMEREGIMVHAFKAKDAVTFINYRFINYDLSPTTFNNYKRFYNLLWKWFIKNKYVRKNPFEGIDKMKELDKVRVIIEPEYRRMISEDLLSRDPVFYIICMLCYHGLMRPKEIALTKIRYIDTGQSIIRLPSYVAKNGKMRIVTIPYHLNEAIKQLGLHEYYPLDHYAFAAWKRPGVKPVNTRKIDKWWDKMRKRLDLPMNLQFYSLKDTGIVQLLEDGVSINDVKELADHSSLEITSKYLKFVRKGGIDAIKRNTNRF